MSDIRRLTAPDIGARKGGEPIVCLTSYHAHTARILDGYCDVILVGDSLGMVMHGLESTVPVTLDMMILQGQRGDARLEAGAGGRRSAVRLLRSIEGAGLRFRRAGAEGNRLRRDQARRRPAHGGDDRLSGRARRAGDGPCRFDPAGDQHHRVVPCAGSRRRAIGRRSRPMRARSPTPVRFPSCSRRSPSRSRAGSPARSRSRPSASAPASPATARSSCSRICSGLSPRVPKFVKRFGELDRRSSRR